MVNDAGVILHSLHPWEWAKGRIATINLEPDNDLAPLPLDVMDIVSLRRPGTFVRKVQFVSVEQIHNIKGVTQTTTGWYWGAVRWLPVDGDPSEEPRPHLYLHPTPTSPDELELIYRSEWPELTKEEDILPMPRWVHPLFTEIFRQMVLGYEEHEGGTVAARLQGLRESDLFRYIRSRDGSLVPSIGVHTGGAGQRNSRFGSSHGGYGSYGGIYGESLPWPTEQINDYDPFS